MLACAALAGFAAPAAAQTEQTLVSNLGQTSNGSVGSGSTQFGVAFSTGPNAEGYTLNSVDMDIRAGTGSEVTLQIWSATNANRPNAREYTLVNPSTGELDGVETFTAPANTVLKASTRYFLLFNRASASIDFEFNGTDSDSETSDYSWIIGDSFIYLTTVASAPWQFLPRTPRFAIKGVEGAAVANAAPTFTEGDTATREVAENTAADRNVGLPVAATDTDAGAKLSYSLGGTDAASFDIDSETGQIKTKAPLDFETTQTYTVTVTVSDGTDTDSITVTIDVTDIKPPQALQVPSVPTATATANSLEVQWEAPPGDGGLELSYDIRYRKSGAGSWIDGPQGVTGKGATITGLEAGTAYEVQVQATTTEGDSGWSSSVVGTTVGDPTVTIAAAASVSEADDEVVFTLTRTGATTAKLTVKVQVTEEGDVLANAADYANPVDVEFGIGEDNAKLAVALDDDSAYDPDLADPTKRVGGRVTAAVQAGTGYVPGAVSSVTVDVTDDEDAPLTAALTLEPASPVAESVGTVTVVLTVETGAGARQPRKTYGATLSSRAGTASVADGDYQSLARDVRVTVSDFEIVGTVWRATERFTIQIHNDDVDEEDETFRVITEIPPPSDRSNLPATDPLTVTIVDDDTRGVTVDPTALTVTEGGEAVTYTVVLDSEPTETVTVTVTDTAEATASPETLEFTADNWSMEQTVTVEAVDDTLVEDAETATLTHTVTGGDYAGETAADVTVTVRDDDEANAPATGTVTISDTTPAYGEALTAAVTNAADGDGLTSPTYTYAWLRVAPGGTPVVIAGADTSTYTPVVADIGQTLQARVSFTDDKSNAETLTSQATAVVTQRVTVSLAVAPTSIREDAVSKAVTVTVTAVTETAAPPSAQFRVTSSTNDEAGSADSGLDFDPLSEDPRFAVSEFELSADGTVYEAVKTFMFDILDDDVDEMDEETFQILVQRYPGIPSWVTLPDAVTVTIIDDDDVPGAPTTLAATPGDTKVTLSWGAPSDAGTSSVTGYEYRQSSDGGSTWGSWTDAGDVLEKEIAGLTNGTEYTFEVRAVSAAGDGAAERIAGTPAAAVANAAPRFTSSATADVVENTTAVLTVVAEDSDAEDDITGYTLTGGADQLKFAIDATSGALTFATAPDYENPTDVGTNNGYVVIVQATSGTGTRAMTADQTTMVTVTDATAPSAPTNFAAVRLSTDSAQLTFDAPPDGGLAITGYEYRIQRGTVAFRSWTPLAEAQIARKALNPAGLTAGALFRFELRAENAEGKGAAASTTEAMPTAPGVVRTLAAQAGDTQVTLTWEAPTQDGGVPSELGYQWRSKAGDGNFGSWRFLNAKTVIVDSLTNDVAHTFEVRAAYDVPLGFLTGPAASVTKTPAAAVTNVPATGTVTISDTMPAYGEVLTAAVTNAADGDGLTSATYSYAWLRGAPGGTPAVIAGADSSTYTPVVADIGRTLQARVSFTDDKSNPETLTSQPTAVVTQVVTVSLAVAPTRIFEDAASKDVVATLTITTEAAAAPTAAISISLYTVDVIASAALDYTAAAEGRIAYAPGDFSLTGDGASYAAAPFTYTVATVRSDSLEEHQPSVETFEVGVRATAGTTLPSWVDLPGVATVTIVDEDTRGLVLTPATLRVVEEDPDGETYTVALRNEPFGTVTVAVSGQGTGLTVTPDSLTFTTTNWRRAQEVTVKAGNDANTVDESVTLTHTTSGTHYDGLTGTVAVTVADNDRAGVSVTGPAEVDESDGEAVFTLTRPGATTAALTVQVQVTEEGDVLDNAADYANPVSVTFGIGSAEETLTVEIDDDLAYDPDISGRPIGVGGRVTAELQAGTGYTLGSPSEHTVDVIDDEDSPLTATFSIDPSPVPEDAGTVTVTVTLATAPGGRQPTKAYNYAFENIRSGATAVAGQDYRLAGDFEDDGFVPARDYTQADSVWRATASRSITILDDEVDEADETIRVEFVNYSGGSQANHDEPDPLTVTILDDDDVPGAPTNLAATPGDAKVTLSWGAPSDAGTSTVTGYEYRQSSDGGSTWGSWTDAGDVLEKEVTGLTNGTEYTFEVRAVSAAGDGAAERIAGTPAASAAPAVSISTTPTSVSETGEEAVFTLARGGPTTAALTVQVQVTEEGDVLANAADYTNPVNVEFLVGAAEATLTVAVDDDDVYDPDLPGAPMRVGGRITAALQAGTGYTLGTPATHTVDVTDDEDAPLTAALTLEPASPVAESVGTVAVVLTVETARQPGNTYSSTISSRSDTARSAEGDFEVLTAQVLVPPSGFALDGTVWRATLTWTIDIHDDDVDEQDETFRVITETPPPSDLSNLPATDALTVTILDDDTRGVTVDPTALTVTEGGEAVTYTVVLDSEPSDTVTVTVTDTAEATARPETLEFTADNWSMEQTVTVEAVDDRLVEDAETATLTHTVTGGDYAGETAADVTVTVTDNDVAGITVDPTTLTVDEGDADGAIFTVVLTAQLVGNETATVTVTGQSGTDLAVTPAPLTFNALNWNLEQTVTVTARDDSDTNDDEVTLTLTPSGSIYEGAPAKTVTVTVRDDDTASAPATGTVTISDTMPAYGEVLTAAVTNAADGDGLTSATYSYAWLRGAPGGTPAVIAGADSSTYTPVVADIGRTLQARVSFTDDKSNPETLTSQPTAVVTQVVTVSLAVAPTRIFEDAASKDVVATLTITTEAAAAPTAAISISLYTVDVIASAALDYTAAAEGRIAYAPGDFSLTGDGASYAAAPFTYTVATVRSDSLEEHQPSVETFEVGARATAGTTLPSWVDLPSNATVTIVDEDTRGLVLTPATLRVVEEDPDGQTYTVALRNEPFGTVTVAVTGQGTDLTVTPDNLTFTTTNWRSPQEVTVKAGNDANTVDESVTLTHTTSGTHYDGLTGTVAVTVADNDRAGVSVTGPAEVDESDGEAVFTLTRPGATTAALTVQVQVTEEGDVLDNAADYANPVSVTFGIGDAEKTLTVEIDDDLAYDPDISGRPIGVGGRVTAELQAGTGYTLGSPSEHTVDVIDDEDSPLTATFSIDPSPVPEDAGTVTVTVTLATAPGGRQPTKAYNYAFENIRSGATAVAGQDYRLAGDFEDDGFVPARDYTQADSVWRATASRSITILDDEVDEADETIRVEFVNYSGGSQANHDEPDPLTVTILDDDDVPGAPTNLAATPGDAKVTLSWGAPSDAGTSTVTGYEYRQSSDGGSTWGSWTDAGDVLEKEVTGLTNGTEYTFEVRAVSAAGDGAAAPITGTPAANAAPAFTSVDTASVAENTTTVLTVVATDGDAEDDITGYALTGGADISKFAIDGSSGALTFATAPDYENPTDAGPDNTYVVIVQATGGAGDRAMTATQTITVTVTDDDTEAPGAPDAPTFPSATASGLTVNWSAPANAGPAITDYDVRWRVKTPPGSWTELEDTTDSTDLSATITGLTASETYEVQVRAQNAEGTGEWSASGDGTTNAAANAAPTFTSSATAEVAENTTAVLTVVATDGDAEDDITGYALTGGADISKFAIDGSSGALTFATAPDYENPTDAGPDNTYVVIVQATGGAGDRAMTATQTITVTVTDDDTEAPGAPDAPTFPSATASGLTVNWSAPANAGPAITDYDVRWRVKTPPGSWTELEDTTDSTDLSATITGLTASETYEVQVRAQNAEGTGEWSASGDGTTNAAANAAPTFTSSATAEVAENTTAVLTVVATDGDAEDDITGYALTGGADISKFAIDGSSGALTFADAPDYENPTDAGPDNTYVVIVQATGGAGDRAMTATQTITVTVTDDDTEAPGAPDAPTFPSATASGLTVNWSAPANAGPAIADYDVRWRVKTPPGSWTELEDTTDSTDLSATITGLTASETYEVQVRAQNAEGTGGWSASGDGTTDAAANAAPSFTSSATANVEENTTTVLTVVATDGDTADSITGYALTGGADISKFAIDGSNGVLTFATAPDYENPTDAEPYNSYVVIVQATGGAGDRAMTAEQTITVTVADDDTEAPGAPAAPSATAGSDATTLIVTWTAPSNAGPPIDDYDVRWRVKTPPGSWTELPDTTDSTATTASITGLTATTTYQVQVRAGNDEGDGNWSTSGEGTTGTADNAAPTFTSSNTVSVAENTTTVLTVVATDGDAEDDITGYALTGAADQSKFAIDGSSGALTFATAPDYENPTDVGTNNSYVVIVQATSGAGDRALTAEQTITVTVTDDDAEAPGAPAAPTFGTATASSLVVNWSAPTNAGPAISDYDVRWRVKGSGATWTELADTTDSTDLTAAIAGLAASTEYEVQVRAENAEGTGGWSASGDGTTDAAAVTPPAVTPVAVCDGAQWSATMTVGGESSGNYKGFGWPITSGGSLTADSFSYGGTDYKVEALWFRETGTPEYRLALSGALPSNERTDFTLHVGSVSLALAGAELQDNGKTFGWADDSHRDSFPYDRGATVQVCLTSVAASTNAAPTFTSSATAEVEENTTAVLTVVATDGDAEDGITGYTLTGGADISKFAIDESSGALTFATAPDFENPTDAEPYNSYVVNVQATSGTGSRALTATQTIAVTVTDDDTEAPGAPAAPTFPSATANSLTLSWAAPTNAGPAITDYDVRWRVKGSGATWTEADDTTDSTDLTATITGLAASTEYEVQVRAQNAEGDSEWSASGDGTTNAAANAAPSFTSSATANVEENTTTVLTVVATDGDTADSITGYALTGGADISKFAIDGSNGVLTFATAPDYENPTDAGPDNTYVVIVQATGGAGDRAMTATQTITVTVTDDDTEAPGAPDAPTFPSATASGLTVNWSAPANAGPAIADYDVRWRVKTPPGSWTELEDTTDSTDLSATITGLTASETYEVQVRAQNAEGTGGWSASGDGTTDAAANAAPSFTSSATANVEENTTTVLTVVATDGDTADSITGYALTGGADISKFAIDGSNGVLTFATAPDYENPTDAEPYNSYVVIVQATSGAGDRALTAEQTITVTVTDVAEQPATPGAPTVRPTSDSILEVSWTAPGRNGGPALTGYEVQYRQGTSGDWSNQPHSGLGRTSTITGLNAATSYQVRVRARNGETPSAWSTPGSGRTGSSTNSAPTFPGATATRSVAENTVAGTNIGAPVSATDDDAGDTLTYSLEGADADSFDIVASSGQLRTRAALDYEAKSRYAVTVRVSDGDIFNTIAVRIIVTDVDERPRPRPDPNRAPRFTSAASASVAENTVAVLRVRASDADARDSVTGYSLVGGADRAKFTIEAASGALSFLEAPDYERPTDTDVNNVYVVIVRSTSGTGFREKTSSQTITVTVTDEDAEAPGRPAAPMVEASTHGSLSVQWAEPANAGPDISDYDVRYRVKDSGNAWTELDDTTHSTVTTASIADLSAGTAYEAQVRAENAEGAGEWSASGEGTTNAAPVFAEGEAATRSVTENTAAGEPVGAPVTATDADAGDTLTYALEGADAASFAIDASTGRIQTRSALDYETKSRYTLTVTAEDTRGGRAAIAVTVEVTDVDERPAVSIEAGPDRVTEGAAATFTLHRTAGAGAGALTVSVAVGESGDMLEAAAPASVTFPADAAQTTLRVPTRDDAADEPESVVTARVTAEAEAPYRVGSPASASVTVEDNDDMPGLSVADSAASEDAGTMTFAVTLGAPSARTVTVEWMTSDGTATADADYEAASGTLALSPGETAATIAVKVLDDALDEAETETFTVTLANADNATLEAPEGTGTILDDEALPGLSVADAAGREDAGTMTFAVTLGAPSARTVTVDWATSDGTATAGSDYEAVAGTLTLSPGETAGTVNVPVLDDGSYEAPTETFTVRLANASNATVLADTATGTIADNEEADGATQAWLSRFGRSVAGNLIEGLNVRFEAPPPAGAQLTVNGQRLDGSRGVAHNAAAVLNLDRYLPLHTAAPGTAAPGGPAAGRSGAVSPAAGPPTAGLPTASPAAGGLAAQYSAATSGAPGLGLPRIRLRDLLRNSAFHYAGQAGQAGAPDAARWSVWGRTAGSGFEGEDAGLSNDGEVLSALLGADYERGRVLAGLALSYSDGAGGVGAPDGSARADMQSTLTSVHPYLRLAATDSLSVWGTLGLGEGDMSLVSGGSALGTDVEMRLGAVGLKGALPFSAGGLELSVKSDVFAVRMLTEDGERLDSVRGEASRARLVLAGSGQRALSGGGVLSPSVEVGVRYDAGDAEAGGGVEVGAGLQYSNPRRRLTMAVNARMLVAHEHTGYEEWGLGASVLVRPDASGRGASLKLGSTWGAVASGVEGLWSRRGTGGLARGGTGIGPRPRYEVDFGYGLSARRTLLTPYLGASGGGGGARGYRLGVRTQAASPHARPRLPIDLSVELTYRQTPLGAPDHGIELRFSRAR